MNRLILHYHEIWLKGGNKNYFLSRLLAAVRRAVADLPVESVTQVAERLVLVPGDEAAVEKLAGRLARVFGLAYLAVARAVEPDPAAMARAACELMGERNPATFAVRAKIADHNFVMSTMELERALGRAVLDHLRTSRPDTRVDLDRPEVTCRVEVVPAEAFLYTDRIEGAGGLPAATSGRLVALLSGGFDSAVAAYKMMRRGAHVSFAHFASAGSASLGPSAPVAEEIVRALTPYQFSSRLYVIPFEPVQRRIVAAAPESLRVLLYRRMMARISREIARVERALGLVTGDSVSQVASQTLHNLAAVDHGLGMTVYRPLAGDDKAEITALARRIGTYAISCGPFEDCCPRFMPRAPAIFSTADELLRAEAPLEIDALVTMGLESATAADYSFEQGQVTRREGLPGRFQKLLSWRKAAAAPEASPAPLPAKS